MARSAFAAIAAVLFSPLLTGCYLVTNLDRFNEQEAAAAKPVNAYRDMKFVMNKMKYHAANYFQYRVVNDDNVTLTSGTLDPVGATTGAPVIIYVAGAVPRSGKCRLDFYADTNNSRNYDGIGDVKEHKDHAWRIAPLNDPDPAYGALSGETLVFTFTHDFNFTDINLTPDGQADPSKTTGFDVTIQLNGTASLAGKLLEARVVDQDSGRVTGLYRFPQMSGPPVTAKLAGVVESGVGYAVEVYADANGDGVFQPTGVPGGDGGWRVPFTATDAGASVTLDLESAPQATDITFVYGP